MRIDSNDVPGVVRNNTRKEKKKLGLWNRRENWQPIFFLRVCLQKVSFLCSMYFLLSVPTVAAVVVVVVVIKVVVGVVAIVMAEYLKYLWMIYSVFDSERKKNWLFMAFNAK